MQIDESFRTDSRIWLLEDCRGVFSYTQGKSAEATLEITSIGKVTRDGVVIIASR